MFAFITVVIILFAILLLEELSWRHKVLKGEDQRKLSHIFVGTFGAFWPWLVSWHGTELLGLGLLAGALINHYSHWFHWLAGVRRKGYGHIFFALAFIVCAWLADTKLFFALAILNLSLGDGLAAVVGKRYGQKQAYKVFGQTKTVLGSITFWLVSLIIIGVGLLFAPSQVSPAHYAWLLIGLPPLLAIIENVSPYGLDNLTVPVAALLVLTWLN